MTDGLTLAVEPGSLAVLRLEAGAAIPAWFQGPGFRALLEGASEQTLVLRAERVPSAWAGPQERGFRALRVEGTLDFALVGVLADLAGALAEAGVSLLAYSSFDTDWLLVREERLGAARRALEGAGHHVLGS